MSKTAVIEVRENVKKRKNEYFVKGFDITESIEFLLAEVEKDYEFKKQVELQCGLHTCNDFLNKQAEKYKKKIADQEAKLAEKEKLLNQYPYKNDVIEEQYEKLKDGIKFRIENNITDDWEQHYHCIDVLCEKHKARITDIENSICHIEKLEKQLTKKEKEIEVVKNLKAKEVGEALSCVIEKLTDIISQKLDTATLLDIAQGIKGDQE